MTKVRHQERQEEEEQEEEVEGEGETLKERCACPWHADEGEKTSASGFEPMWSVMND